MLALVHQKSPKYSEELVNNHLEEFITETSIQGDIVLKAGCLLSLVQFSRNSEQRFLEVLDSFIVELQVLKVLLINKSNPEMAKKLMENFYAIHQERGSEYINTIYKKSQAIMDVKTKVGRSSRISSLAKSVFAIEEILYSNMRNLVSPYINSLMTFTFILENSTEGCDTELYE